jgi:hypothetical protein
MKPTLLSELAAAAPSLPGARCVGLHDLYDRTDEGTVRGHGGAAEVAQARAEALEICAACPALAACRQWTDRQRPRDLPLGVIAGRVHLGRGRMLTTPPPRRTKAS